MSIDSTSASSSVLDQYQIKNAGPKTNELGKDEFLNLLVAQLNNQDPLAPQDNGAFIAQLAQFSQVEGIGKLNTSMESLLSGYQSSQALQASSLVGRSVIVPTDKPWSIPRKPLKPAWLCRSAAVTSMSTSTTIPVPQ